MRLSIQRRIAELNALTQSMASFSAQQRFYDIPFSSRRSHSVCKRINFAVEPEILSNITLSSRRLSSQVESLVTTEPKPTSASKYATKLHIGHLCPSPDEDGVISFEEAKIRLFLLPAISSLVGVRQIIWDLGEYDPEWATLLVTDALASLPALEDLHLSVWLAPDSPCVQFQRLSNLKKFTVISDFNNRTAVIRTVAGLIGWNQPELTNITIVDDGYYSDGYAPTLQDFLAETSSSVCLKITHLNLSGLFVKFDAGALRHLRSLISLTIMNISSPYDETTEYQGPEFLAQKIWSTLRSEKIHLQELVTDNAQPALVEYLTSFSGLRRLRLTRTSSYHTPQQVSNQLATQVSNQLAIHFYEQGLENHISFLEALEVHSSYEGMWCFGKHCSNIIKKATRLSLLELSINSEDIPRGEEKVHAYAKSQSPTKENAIGELGKEALVFVILKSIARPILLGRERRSLVHWMRGSNGRFIDTEGNNATTAIFSFFRLFAPSSAYRTVGDNTKLAQLPQAYTSQPKSPTPQYALSLPPNKSSSKYSIPMHVPGQQNFLVPTMSPPRPAAPPSYALPPSLNPPTKVPLLPGAGLGLDPGTIVRPCSAPRSVSTNSIHPPAPFLPTPSQAVRWGLTSSWDLHYGLMHMGGADDQRSFCYGI
ncbi:uncharacterized protein LACBIDRAFT_331353 [Laccaria bicolor S238N-H82]|uniref:Predicted protein n=1 Tax=Laccaria bicolor (strain S238N-H82 / ATCC MYA-4686) TaxID=486041 RepID=B0DP83_LACBS|nr:uncharacterized protein LACBIDRAFT_331353 [Laccaria bicolor S238N-H82]EDR03570.1 predicted protein [Laccaria bicolor S238N-H82]|eukprot:XP_001885718.1 predicted protein [Laccaria bicolor S238N-H82]